ncbi:SWI5-dependent HO expression protein 4 [Rhodotorula kratochvilovae]
MAPSPSSSAREDTAPLEALLKRAPPLNLTQDDLESVYAALALRGKPHTLALAILARFLSPSPTPPTRSALQASLEALLAGTDSRDLVRGLRALSAVLQVAPTLAAQLLQAEALRSRLEEAVELLSQPPATACRDGAPAGDERLALVELLALAAGQAGMRALVRRAAGRWLEGLLGAPGESVRAEDARVKTLAGVAVVKLRLGRDEGAGTGVPLPPEEREVEERSPWTLEELARLAVRLVPLGVREKQPGDEVLLPALEALAYLTLYPSPAIKKLATDSELLTSLFSLAPKQPTAPTASSSARDYAIATLLDHLTAFPAPDAEGEAAQLERLKRFAAAAAAKGTAPKAVPESVAAITARITLLVRHDPSPIPTIRQLCLSPSLQTRRLAARILHALVTPQPLRGTLLQAGAARLFLSLTRQLPAPFSPEEDTLAPQGLAKLLITANPLLVLGPTPDAPLLLEAAAALALPLGAPAAAPAGTGSGADLLPRFEALMALTNLASLSPALASALAALPLRDRATEGTTLLAVVADEHLLSAHTMVRRAAAELVCNLAASDAGSAFFETVGGGARLHVLAALASTEDVPTRTAAAGAWTSLVYSPAIIAAVLERQKWVALLLAPLGDDDAGVRHRVYEVWRVVGEVVGQMEGEGREKARQGLKDGKVRKRLEEARAKERVGELKEIIAAAVEAVVKA